VDSPWGSWGPPHPWSRCVTGVGSEVAGVRSLPGVDPQAHRFAASPEAHRVDASGVEVAVVEDVGVAAELRPGQLPFDLDDLQAFVGVTGVDPHAGTDVLRGQRDRPAVLLDQLLDDTGGGLTFRETLRERLAVPGDRHLAVADLGVVDALSRLNLDAHAAVGAADDVADTARGR